MHRLRAALAASMCAVGCAATPAPDPAPPVAATPAPAPVPVVIAAPHPIGERVRAALQKARDEGNHWHRTDALVALGAEAVPALREKLLGPGVSEEDRALAAQALGRIGGGAAQDALEARLADAATPQELRGIVEESLAVHGSSAHVDRRIELLRGRGNDIAIARIGAQAKIAKTLYAAGRFRESADEWKELVADVPDVEQRGHFAYDWACSAALAGATDEAFEAMAIAVASPKTDLTWMARDGDLAALHGDPRFARLLAGGAGKREPAPNKPARDVAEFDEYRKLHEAYWDGAFEGWIAAGQAYWAGYEAELKASGKERSKESADAYIALHGPEPANPTPEWIGKFRALLAKHRTDEVGVEIRNNLFVMLANEGDSTAWAALYADTLDTPGQERAVAENAHGAHHFGGKATPPVDLTGRLRAWLATHPDSVHAAMVRYEIGRGLRDDGDKDAAKASFDDVVRLHPGTWAAEAAASELHAMKNVVVGLPAPDFETADVRGAPVSLRAHRGRVVVLDFWATWCGPCMGELQHIKSLHEKFQGPDFALVGVSLDGDGLALADALEEHGMKWPQVCDLKGFDGAVPKLYSVRGIPHTVLVGRDGSILALDLRGEELTRAVETALKIPAAAAR